MFSKLAALLVLVPFIVFAAPVEERAAAIDTGTHCGQWDTITVTPYTLYLDQWGLSNASSGSDCATLVSLSGTTLSWKTTWNWVGGNGVKSYTNINLNNGINKKLSAISSIPSTWNWSQSSSGSIVANVAYDLFTSNTSGGSAVNEIMIWLANFNAGPISATYNSAGQPVPVVSNLSLAGRTWNLYQGSNGANNVFSFLPTSGTVTSFNGDINVFLKYLTANRGVSTSQFLTTLQAGTEATSGSATLTTHVHSFTRTTSASLIIFKSKKRMSKESEAKPAASAPATGEEPTFSIQPHPAKTNDPADLAPEQTGGLASNPNDAVFHARDPHVPSAQVMAGLEQPLSREELHKRQEELNKSS
ncbi:Glycoside hydrolase family 12 protein [Mycena indigotica]|uniref:Glycoside hydrolase family 12 protein n=1 Tax=Mycena indigotica TaxID=2126181 RepID=A0A8H6SRY9_9AGAR|nr:Glycoside hydrolase family 12 protein [Mycena indigotica]KAF7303802.1 Glycoside hydrolase family 12 protein [Mycena indigotica]